MIVAHASRTGAIVQAFVDEPWRREVEPITPARIAALARAALASGWIPGHGDGVLRLPLPCAPPGRAGAAGGSVTG